jgi:hypothetical protein
MRLLLGMVQEYELHLRDCAAEWHCSEIASQECFLVAQYEQALKNAKGSEYEFHAGSKILPNNQFEIVLVNILSALEVTS